MASTRDVAINQLRLATKTRASPRVAEALPALAAPQKPPRRRHGEKRTLATAVGFIVALLIIGVIYSGMTIAPPEKPVRETALQAPPPVRTARILLPGSGSQCRQIMFDNDTGLFSVETLVSCESPSPTTSRGNGSSGFSSFKEAFGHRP